MKVFVKKKTRYRIIIKDLKNGTTKTISLVEEPEKMPIPITIDRLRIAIEIFIEKLMTDKKISRYFMPYFKKKEAEEAESQKKKSLNISQD